MPNLTLVRNAPSPGSPEPRSGASSFVGDDAALVAAVRAGQRGASAALFDRHGAHVQRVLVRVLGSDREIADLLHDVFVRALEGIEDLQDGNALKGWLTSIAVFSARGCIRRRSRRSWLRFFGDDAPPEQAAPVASGEVTQALAATYAALDELDPDERIPFALRFIDGMELTEVAAACRVSLATIKRRLARAEERFVKTARKHPVLAEWVEGGARWGTR